MNEILQRFIEIILVDKKRVERIRLIPRLKPTGVLFELSDGTDEELIVSGTRNEIIKKFFDTKDFWHVAHALSLEFIDDLDSETTDKN